MTPDLPEAGSRWEDKTNLRACVGAVDSSLFLVWWQLQRRPPAMNGYLLAKEMGGDADLYAAAATVQRVASLFTIPLVMIAAGQLAAG